MRTENDPTTVCLCYSSVIYLKGGLKKRPQTFFFVNCDCSVHVWMLWLFCVLLILCNLCPSYFVWNICFQWVYEGQFWLCLSPCCKRACCEFSNPSVWVYRCERLFVFQLVKCKCFVASIYVCTHLCLGKMSLFPLHVFTFFCILTFI